jgi:hypothetical protein
MVQVKRYSLDEDSFQMQFLKNCALLIYFCVAVNEHRLLFVDDSTAMNLDRYKTDLEQLDRCVYSSEHTRQLYECFGESCSVKSSPRGVAWR